VKYGNFSQRKMASFNKRTPKKHLTNTKHGVLGKKNGDMHKTHNTPECSKYAKNSTPKKGFIGRRARVNSCRSQTFCCKCSAYVWLTMKLEKLKQSNKKL
jgi:hypothetical protein